jgi:2'-5' RNA ligase
MIKSFKQFISSLLEKKGDSHSYGCAMVYFDFPEMTSIHRSIDPDDVYTETGDRSFGLEDEPHTTLLYGLHSNEIPDEQVMEICKSEPISEIKLSNPSLFENEQYDVLKFDATCESLNSINSKLSELPHTTNFPDYHPHATIGYLKPGTGKKYADLFAGKEFMVVPTKIVYSKPDGNRIEESWS